MSVGILSKNTHLTGDDNSLEAGAALTLKATSVIDVQAAHASSILDKIGSTRGSLLERGAAAWAAITPGTAGHPLFSAGAGGDPVYRAIASDDVTMPKVGSPAGGSLLTRDFTTRGSAGVIDGTVAYITIASATTIDVAAGEGYIRTTNDQQGELKFITWPASLGITIPSPAAGDETTRFVGVEYNAGVPQITVRTTFNWNWYTDFPLGRVSIDTAGDLTVLNTMAHSEDTANLTRKFLRVVLPFQRESSAEGTGGLVFGELGTRNVSMTAGALWMGLNRFAMTAIDTSASGDFDLFYRRTPSGWNEATATQWPNTQYDDGSGTLADLTNNRYGNLWVYLDVADNRLNIVYGRGNYVLLATAEEEAAPSLPDHLSYQGRLLARLIFQKSGATATLIESAWAAMFSGSAISDHNQLSNLQGGTASEYYHMTAAQNTLFPSLASFAQVSARVFCHC
jgi:hypothetical protein